MQRQSGFTLAEVLITLAIIGTVAAMTIPTLMTNTNKMEFKTGFKKILSTCNQAITMSVALNYIDFSDTTSEDNNATTSILGIFINRMHVTRTVYGTSTETAVNRMFKSGASANFTVFFADGMALSFKKTAKNCRVSNSDGGAASICKAIVDVNGTRPPNYLSNCLGTQTKTATSDKTANGGTCTPENAAIFDQFSIFLADQQVQPNGQCAKYVLFEN